MVQYKHTEHKQARRNERPLYAIFKGKGTLRKRESKRLWIKRDRERKQIADRIR